MQQGQIKDGKYVMPAFQRQYVWSMEQIEKLWDSILLEYYRNNNGIRVKILDSDYTYGFVKAG